MIVSFDYACFKSYELFYVNFVSCRCLLLVLASSFVEAADADLINLFFDYIRSSLMVLLQSCSYQVSQFFKHQKEKKIL